MKELTGCSPNKTIEFFQSRSEDHLGFLSTELLKIKSDFLFDFSQNKWCRGFSRMVVECFLDITINPCGCVGLSPVMTSPVT